jgi:hypothetical protein
MSYHLFAQPLISRDPSGRLTTSPPTHPTVPVCALRRDCSTAANFTCILWLAGKDAEEITLGTRHPGLKRLTLPQVLQGYMYCTYARNPIKAV